MILKILKIKLHRIEQVPEKQLLYWHFKILGRIQIHQSGNTRASSVRGCKMEPVKALLPLAGKLSMGRREREPCCFLYNPPCCQICCSREYCPPEQIGRDNGVGGTIDQNHLFLFCSWDHLLMLCTDTVHVICYLPHKIQYECLWKRKA